MGMKVSNVEKVIATGVSVNPGLVDGKSVILNNPDEINKVMQGDIVIIPDSDPKYAVAVLKASAVICENGGRLSHICIVTMEMGIPCITQVKDARKLIPDQTNIFVDAVKGQILINK